MVQQYNYLSSVVLHLRVLSVGLEPLLLHHPDEHRGVVAPGIGEDRLAFRGKQLGNQVSERHGVRTLVEDVGAEDEVEGRRTRQVGRAPVEEGGLEFPAEVGAGVVGGEVQGGFVVVGREDSRAA